MRGGATGPLTLTLTLTLILELERVPGQTLTHDSISTPNTNPVATSGTNTVPNTTLNTPRPWSLHAA